MTLGLSHKTLLKIKSLENKYLKSYPTYHTIQGKVPKFAYLWDSSRQFKTAQKHQLYTLFRVIVEFNGQLSLRMSTLNASFINKQGKSKSCFSKSKIRWWKFKPLSALFNLAFLPLSYLFLMVHIWFSQMNYVWQ